MKTKTTIACALALLSLAGRVLALSAPPPVTGVTAEAINGQVVVQWNPVTTDPIDYYRVYYSNYSILENDGLYDDFEVTKGDETNLTFVPPPDLNDLYIAVIAVATSGEESEYFTEETYIKVSTGGPAVPPPKPTPENPEIPEIPEHTTLKLLKGTVTSPTEMQMEFSTSITVDAEGAPKGLKITRSDGSLLHISGITIEGKIVTIRTETQKKGVVYNVQFSEPFVGKNGQPLDADDRAVLVTGHADGSAATMRSNTTTTLGQPTGRVSNPYAPPELENLSIVPQVQPNGAYTVTVEWTVDNTPGDLYGIVAYQTRDGQTFSPPSLLPVDIRGVQLQNVTPGFFGLYLQTINVYGVTSTGAFQYITLPEYVPGQGFRGDLTATPVTTDDTDMATLDVISDDTKTMPIEEATKLAAEPKQVASFDWKVGSILATVVATAIVLFVALCSMCMRRNCSTEQ